MTGAFVLAGGARIDDGGNTITISQNIQSGAALDGGLTKSGVGSLTLSGTNTYNGGTTVLEGTLILNNNEAVADGSSLTVGNPSLFPEAVVPSAAVSSVTGAASAISSVPEPGSMALLAMGAMVALWGVRRRRIVRSAERAEGRSDKE
jgi:autotransporter-associated beta strand protein